MVYYNGKTNWSYEDVFRESDANRIEQWNTDISNAFGASNGIPTLDATGNIPMSQLKNMDFEVIKLKRKIRLGGVI